MMFQAVAPTRHAAITGRVTDAGATMSFAMVDATFGSKIRNATKLKIAAHRTAQPGFITRVETTVAIEFAASCMPLPKSNASARATMPHTIHDSGIAGPAQE